MDTRYFFARPGCHVHFIGIGGVSMSQLAELLLQRGCRVTGSDTGRGSRVTALRSVGIAVSDAHDGSLPPGADVVVRSAAIHDDNAEAVMARQAGIPVFERADLLGEVMHGYRHSVCVSGTHGKTTTTSMLTHIALTAGLSPTAFIGAKTPTLPKGFCIGASDIIITESCEYYNSFLKFYPTICLILNIEPDHLDFFRDIDDLINAFRAFARRTPRDGTIVVNREDANAMRSTEGMRRLTFGLSALADIRAADIVWARGLPRFDVTVGGELYTHIELAVPGEHNLCNALAAAAAAHLLDIDGGAVSEAMATFRAAERRMEYKGSLRGAEIYDDYAHHPTAITVTLEAARQMGFARVLLVFQPYTYSRTASLFNEFIRALSDADRVFLPDTYAARETPDAGIDSEYLASRLPNGQYLPDFGSIADVLYAEIRPGDIVITMGAGDVYKVAALLLDGDR